jgi:hypothetical protein
VGPSENFSIHLAPEHQEILAEIQVQLVKAKETASNSKAIQLALLAFDKKTDLHDLIKRNRQTDRRRVKA